MKCTNCGGEIKESFGTGIVSFKYQCHGRCGSYYDESDIETYLKQWHRFIDHLASGKDADSFFRDLLAKEKVNE